MANSMATGSSACLDPKYAKTPNAIDIGSAGGARSYTPGKTACPLNPGARREARRRDDVSCSAALATSTE